MSKSDAIGTSLREWLDINLPNFLLSINSELLEEEEWKMPFIEDYCLVVAVSDYSDGNGGVFTIHSSSPEYRLAGLLTTALNF
jgi:hypothetical protein